MNKKILIALRNIHRSTRSQMIIKQAIFKAVDGGNILPGYSHRKGPEYGLITSQSRSSHSFTGRSVNYSMYNSI